MAIITNSTVYAARRLVREAAESIRAGRRVDLDQLRSMARAYALVACDGSAIRHLATRIEDHIDEDCSDETREEIAMEAERLALELC